MRISLATMAPLIDGCGVSLTVKTALADFGLMDDMVVVLLELVIVFMLRLGTGRPAGVHGKLGHGCADTGLDECVEAFAVDKPAASGRARSASVRAADVSGSDVVLKRPCSNA